MILAVSKEDIRFINNTFWWLNAFSGFHDHSNMKYEVKFEKKSTRYIQLICIRTRTNCPRERSI